MCERDDVLICCPQGQYADWCVAIRVLEYRPQRYIDAPTGQSFQTEAVLRLKGWTDLVTLWDLSTRGTTPTATLMPARQQSAFESRSSSTDEADAAGE